MLRNAFLCTESINTQNKKMIIFNYTTRITHTLTFPLNTI